MAKEPKAKRPKPKAPPRRPFVAKPTPQGRRKVRARVKPKGFIPTNAQRDQVMDMVAANIGQRAIALVLKISESMLQTHFRGELDDGQLIRNAQIGGGIVKSARDENAPDHKTMAIYATKALMGWRDSVRLGFEDSKGQPVDPVNLFTVQITGTPTGV